MAFNRRAVLIIMVSITVLGGGGTCYGGGVFYKVGDSAGWGGGRFFDYKTWSSAKTFKVGDTIVFEYDKQKHNVIELRHLEYHFCNTTSPVVIYSSGNDSITLKFPGHYYYTCGFVGQCKAGVKVDFKVLPTSQIPVESPFTPSVPRTQTPIVEIPPTAITPIPPSPPSPRVPSSRSPSVDKPPSPSAPSPPSPTVKRPSSPTAPSPLSPSDPSPSVSGSSPDPPPKPQIRSPTAYHKSVGYRNLSHSLGLFALGLWVAYFGY